MKSTRAWIDLTISGGAVPVIMGTIIRWMSQCSCPIICFTCETPDVKWHTPMCQWWVLYQASSSSFPTTSLHQDKIWSKNSLWSVCRILGRRKVDTLLCIQLCQHGRCTPKRWSFLHSFWKQSRFHGSTLRLTSWSNWSMCVPVQLGWWSESPNCLSVASVIGDAFLDIEERSWCSERSAIHPTTDMKQYHVFVNGSTKNDPAFATHFRFAVTISMHLCQTHDWRMVW